MPESFDDPQLKAATRRAWGEESAPADLRRRISAVLVAEANSPTLNESPAAAGPSIVIRSNAAPSRWSIGPRARWTAIAALVLISIAMIGYHLSQKQGIPGENLPLALVQPILATHIHCCAATDHHFVPKPDAGDFAATGKWLSTQAKIPVLSVALGNGWNFCGAGPCPVGGTRSGHLLFKRGKQELSIFSLPASTFQLGAADKEYAANIQDHWIAGFTRKGGLYCVIAYDPEHDLTAAQVEQIRSSLMSDFSDAVFTADDCQPPRPTLVFDDGD